MAHVNHSTNQGMLLEFIGLNLQLYKHQTVSDPRPNQQKSSSSKIKLEQNLSYYDLQNESFVCDIIDVNVLEKDVSEITVCINFHHQLPISKL